MTLSTVHTLAASARAYLARAVTPTQARSAGDASTALPDARPRESAVSRGDRKAEPEDRDTAVQGHRKTVRQDEDAALQGHRKPVSRDDDAGDSPDVDKLDTGALVARFFDVLQAAAQAGGGSPTRAGEAASGAGDGPSSASGEAETLAASGSNASPLDGAAMAMPWARTWSAQDGTVGEAAHGVPALPPLGSQVDADADADAASLASPSSSSSTTDVVAASSAAVSASMATASAWPLYGPPASRPSARGTADPSARQGGRGDADLADATVAASPAVSVKTSLAADPTSAADGTLDRLHRTSVAGAAGPSSRTDAGAFPSGSVDALWPWPSTPPAVSSTAGTVSLSAGSPAEWREALSQALGDRLQLTLKQGGDQAVIRLDPPMLGRIDLSIRQDGAALTVHLSASNPDVLRQLQAMGDGLRQDLAHRHAGDLTVTVAPQPSRSSADADARQPGSRHGEDADPAAPGLALAEADADGGGGDHGDQRRHVDPREARRTASFASLNRTFGAA